MATNPKTSPKVKYAGLASAAVIVIIAILSALTPEMLDFAGRFTPVVYAGVTSIVAVLTAYAKRDPDREIDITQPPEGYEPLH